MTKAPESPLFKISTFKDLSADIAEMVVSHPVTGEPTSWVIDFAGPGHEVTRQQMREATARGLRDTRKKDEARVNGRKYVAEIKQPDDLARENAEFFAARMLDWRGVDMPFSREAAITLLLDPDYGKVYNQIIEFLGADNSFTKRSGGN